VNQFLASRNIYGTFKQPSWRFRQGNFAVASPVRSLSLSGSGVMARSLLAVLVHALHATSTLVDRIDLTTKLSLSSLDRLPASRLLLPRSGLERSDFVLWLFASFRCRAASWSLSGKSRHRTVAEIRRVGRK
jgi:hypothetical protein